MAAPIGGTVVYAVDWAECRRKAREPLERRIAELEEALRVIRDEVRRLDTDVVTICNNVYHAADHVLGEK
jgi:hypothetical protein